MNRSVPGTVDCPGEEFIYVEVLKDEGPRELIDEYSGAVFEKTGRRSPTSHIYDTIVDGSLAMSPNLILIEGSSIGGAGAVIKLPDGKVLYGLSYKGDPERLRKRFIAFCKETNRRCATPKGQSLVFYNGTQIPLSECQVVFYTPKRRPYRSPARSEATELRREPKWESTKPTAELARQLLDREEDTPFELLEIYQFDGDSADVEAHDDDLQELLIERFAADFDRAKGELVKEFGKPDRTADDDDPTMPVGGAFRSSVWNVGGKILYLGAAHEDRELPYLLFIGTGETASPATTV